MEKSVYALFNKVRQNWCNTCDSQGECHGCMVSELLNDIKYLEVSSSTESSEGCAYCWDDKRKRAKEIFFFDAANNMRCAEYCPMCGRKY